jgi:UDP-glucose 4-epimerase
MGVSGSKGVAVVTGASGFVGAAVIAGFTAKGWQVRPITRAGSPVGQLESQASGDIGELESWVPLLAGADVVVHCAGRAHRRKAAQAAERESYARINTFATERLARDCVASGVKRLLFVSSIAVHGPHTDNCRPFAPEDILRPQSVYGESKARAEDAIVRISQTTGLAVTIIRPPAIVGFGAPNNLPLLGRIIKSGAPLPFSSIRNRRMFISIASLASFIEACACASASSGADIYTIADEPVLSTSMLCRVLARAAQVPYREFPLPPGILRSTLSFLGRDDQANAILSSLEVDISKAAGTGWKPACNIDAALGASIGATDAQHTILSGLKPSSDQQPRDSIGA